MDVASDSVTYESLTSACRAVKESAHVARAVMGFGCVQNGPRHIQRAEAARLASESLTTLSKAIETAGCIVRQHSQWFDGIGKYDLRIVDMRLTPTDSCHIDIEARNASEVCLFRILRDGNRWSIYEERGPGSFSRVGSSQLDAFETLGVSQCYLDGVMNAMEFFLTKGGLHGEISRLAKQSCDIAMKAALADFAIKLEEKRVPLADVRALRKTLHRILRKLCADADGIAEFAMPPQEVANSQSESLQLAASFYRLPQVPEESHWVPNVRKMKPFSGVYFYRVDNAVAYVGMSVNIPQRMASHERVPPDGFISFVEMPYSEAVWMEKVYIGVLRPSLNGEANMACKYA